MKAIMRVEGRRKANTLIWSWAGWAAAWATEKTLRQWTVVNGASVVLAFAMPLHSAERILI